MYKIDEIKMLRLGQRDENLAREIQMDASEWLELYPGASIQILFRRPGESTITPMITTLIGTTLTWQINDFEVGITGVGNAEIRAVDVAGLRRKSRIIPCSIEDTLLGDDETVLYTQDQVDVTLAHISEAAQAAQAAQASEEAAALSAQEAGESATSASAAADVAVSARDAAQGAQAAAETAQHQTEAAQSGVHADAEAAEQAKVAAQAAQAGAQGAASQASADRTAAASARADAEAAAEHAEAVVEGIDQAGADQVAAVTAAGQAQVTAVNQAGTTQVGNVNAAGTTQVNAVQAKGTQVINSIPADYSALTNEVTGLKSALDSFASIDNYAFEYGNIYNGSVNTDTNRIHSVDFIRVVQGMTILSFAGFDSMAIPMYDLNKTYKSNGTWTTSFTVPYDGYIRPILRKTGNAQIDTNEFAEIISKIKVCYPNVKITSDTFDKLSQYDSIISNKTVDIQIIKGAIYATGSEGSAINEAHTVNGILNPMLIDVKSGANAHIFLYNNESYIGKFAADGTINKASGNWKLFNGIINVAGLIKGTGANVVRISLLPTDGTVLTEENAQTWGAEHLIIYGGKDAGMSPSAHFINQGMIKTPIRVNRLGSIGAHQSFAKYNGKYYVASSSGDFRVYDSSLNLESSTTLNLGHANTFQVGNSNLAYISGWSNKTIYVLNMDTLIVSDTIVLPIESGYFGAVVDEVNQYAYVVNTVADDTDVAYYQFITYDIAAGSVISEKLIPRKMFAIQGMSYYQGKIYLAYGYTTHTLPNGYIVINTNGDILGEYVIPYLANQEPEGFYVNGNDVLLSVDIDGLLYSIETA